MHCRLLAARYTSPHSFALALARRRALRDSRAFELSQLVPVKVPDGTVLMSSLDSTALEECRSLGSAEPSVRTPRTVIRLGGAPTSVDPRVRTQHFARWRAQVGTRPPGQVGRVAEPVRNSHHAPSCRPEGRQLARILQQAVDRRPFPR